MAAIRLANGFFELWRANYGGARITVYLPGTTTNASLFTDEALTVVAANPQTLSRFTQNGITYGKLVAPIYVGVAHQVDVNGLEQTGVIRAPISSLAAQDAGDSTVIAIGATLARALKDRSADFIEAKDFGLIGPTQSAATNTTTITAAIAAASALSANGARVLLPQGTYSYTSLTVSAGVILEGRGNGSTVLQSQTGANTITVSGDNGGLARLTIDGVNKVANGVGLFARARKRVIMEDVTVKNFETGIYLQGGRRMEWTRVDVDSCTTGVKWNGDNNGVSVNGDELRNCRWNGGVVSNCTTRGIEIKYIDKKVYNNVLAGIGFENNTGTALHIEGARYMKYNDCYWAGNTTDLVIKDGTPTSAADVNTTLDHQFSGGSMVGGIVTFQDKLQDVLLDRMEISAVAFTLTTPQNDVVFRDCVEDSSVTVAGDGTRLSRCRTMLGDAPGSSGVTTTAVATVGWAYKIAAGGVVDVNATIVATGRNVTDYVSIQIAQTARRPGAALNYVAQTINFVAGEIITGATSGAKARVIADADAGATGTLTLKNITKEFVSGEIITGATSAGSATTSGTLTYSVAALAGGTTTIQAIQRSDAGMTAAFQVAADEIQITVTGAAAKTMEWTIAAQVTSTG